MSFLVFFGMENVYASNRFDLFLYLPVNHQDTQRISNEDYVKEYFCIVFLFNRRD